MHVGIYAHIAWIVHDENEKWICVVSLDNVVNISKNI